MDEVRQRNQELEEQLERSHERIRELLDRAVESTAEVNAANDRADEARANIEMQQAFIGRLTARRLVLTAAEQALLVTILLVLIGLGVANLLCAAIR